MYKTKKPIIVSTGLMNNKEIYKMHKNLNKNNAFFLHCVSNYPVKLNNVGLNNIQNLKEKLNCQIDIQIIVETLMCQYLLFLLVRR